MLSWVTLRYQQSDVAPATAEDQALAAKAVVIPLDNRRKRNGGGSPAKAEGHLTKALAYLTSSNRRKTGSKGVCENLCRRVSFRYVTNRSMWPATAGPLVQVLSC